MTAQIKSETDAHKSTRPPKSSPKRTRTNQDRTVIDCTYSGKGNGSGKDRGRAQEKDALFGLTQPVLFVHPVSEVVE